MRKIIVLPMITLDGVMQAPGGPEEDTSGGFKNSEGSEIKVWGRSELVQLLLKHDLVDELWLNIYPVTLGKGKKLFGNDTIPAHLPL